MNRELTETWWEANCSLGGKAMWEGDDAAMKGCFILSSTGVLVI